MALRLLKTEPAGVEECEARPRTFLGNNNNAGGIRNEAFDCSMDDSDGGRGGDCRADCQLRADRTATATADAAAQTAPAPSAPQATQPAPDQDAAKQHLTAARNALSALTQLPAASQLTGEARTQVAQLIANFNELITTQSEWRGSFAKVSANLSARSWARPRPATKPRARQERRVQLARVRYHRPGDQSQADRVPESPREVREGGRRRGACGIREPACGSGNGGPAQHAAGGHVSDAA